MKTVFFGTGDFAATPLSALLSCADYKVCGVVTQPDRPQGRGKRVSMGIVGQLAVDSSIPVFQPESLRKNSAETHQVMAGFCADVFITASYGQILPRSILKIPRLAAINIHASLLPEFRGASPINAALLAGHRRTGVTIMHMSNVLDAGDIILARTLDIPPEYRYTQLANEMSDLGACAMLEALQLIERNTATRTPQDHACATYAPIIKKTDAHINWTDSSTHIKNMTRAYDPWPGPFTYYNETILKIWDVQPLSCENTATPGTILEADSRLVVQTGDGAVEVTCLQAPGGKRLVVDAFLRGRRQKLLPGERLR